MPMPSAPAGKFASKSMAGSTRTISPPSRPPAPILLLRVQQFSGSPTIAPRFRRCAARSRTAPSKLNLFLHITGRRPDGYHTLQTVFQLLDYGDTLHFRVRDDAVIRRATA